MKKLPIILISLLLACSSGTSNKKETTVDEPVINTNSNTSSSVIVPNKSIVEQLKEKRDLYLSLIPEIQDDDGFMEPNDCDTLLWNGLLGASGVSGIDIKASRNENGQWFRRPSKDCYSKDEAGSTISRDMIMGLLWYVWKNKELKLAEELYKYGSDNLWSMGEGNEEDGLDRYVMSPLLIGTLSLIIEKLGGESHLYSYTPEIWNTDHLGYRAHLTVIHILLRADVQGEIEDSEIDDLKKLLDKDPKNPLFQAAYHLYTDGNQTKAIVELLENTSIWPKDRLPTNQDRCERWPVQREYTDKVFNPCDEEKLFAGGGLLFIYQLILGN